MSGAHPTISAWTRDEHEGHYTADLHDWTLKVSWTPNSDDGLVRGSFNWTATRQGQKPNHGHAPFEEMELAMAEAEHFAATDARMRARALTTSEASDR